VRTWSRQVARAAGASLIAPLVLLLAAGVVASGGGLGGLDSLGQIASGPSLPDTGLASQTRSSLAGAEIVGADVAAPSQAARSVPSREQLASATPPTSAPRVARSVAPRADTVAGTRPDSPDAGAPPLTDGREGALAPEGDPAPPASDPVGDLEETTRGLGDSLSEPLGPVTNQLLDLLRLLAPPPR
jgi:hypothetical protein